MPVPKVEQKSKGKSCARGGRHVVPVENQLPQPRVRMFREELLITLRRARTRPLVPGFIISAVALTVAVTLLVSLWVETSVQAALARVDEANLPYHCIILLPQGAPVDALSQKLAKTYGYERHAVVSWARVDSSMGTMVLVGDPRLSQPGVLIPLFNTGFSGDVTLWNQSNQKRTTVATVRSGQGYNLPGWALASPDVLEKIASGPAFVVTIESYLRDSLRTKALQSLASFGNAIDGAITLTPISGTIFLNAAARNSFSVWQTISVGVLIASGFAVACTLTVSFLGRKRVLGILRVLGGTTRDLARLMAVEGLIPGMLGIALGIAVGRIACARFFGAPGGIGPAVAAIMVGGGALALGIGLPLRLVKNASCLQLVNNRPVYLSSNPSCANCGMCGGF